MKKLSRRDFLKLTSLAIAGAVASQIPIKDTPPATVDRFAKEIKFGDNFPPHQLPSGWGEYNTLIGKNAGKGCDNYTVLIGTTAEPSSWYYRTFREMNNIDNFFSGHKYKDSVVWNEAMKDSGSWNKLFDKETEA